MSKNKNVIGHITLKNGEKIEIFMPKMGEMLPAFTGGGNLVELLIVGCTDRTLEWFRDLDLDDGSKILAAAQPAAIAITAAFKAINSPEPTKH